MRLIKSVKANDNYCAVVVDIKDFAPHSNPTTTSLKVASVGAFDVAVSIDEQPGKFVYFPVSSQINGSLLSYLCLYRHSHLNEDPNRTGFFEDNGRVKGIRLRGQVSMGFLLRFDDLRNFVVNNFNDEINAEDYDDGYVFDTLIDYKEGYDPENPDKDLVKELRLVKKYVNVRQARNEARKAMTGGDTRKGKRFRTRGEVDRVVPGQWKQHYNTTILSKPENVWLVKPDSFIHISDKWDGTQGVSSYLLCYKSKDAMTWRERIANFLFGERPTQYEYVLASHRKILSSDATVGDSGFHGPGEKGARVEAHKQLIPFLRKGMTIYYELVGYPIDSDKAFQTRQGLAMDYGCVPMKEGEVYTLGVHYKIYIFRITVTNEDGDVFEFSPTDVQNWCKYNGLMPVIERYVGLAKDLYPDLDVDDPEWSKHFLKRLANDENFFMEKDSPDCLSGAPHEGVVIRFEDMLPHAGKIKTFRFCNREQADEDAGVIDIENDDIDVDEEN
jgi:hypothetical protein